MLSAQRQYFLINKWLDRISIHLVYFMASGDQEELHRMRVETKKIKSLAKLSDECHGTDQLKNSLHFLNDIYRATGKIRQAYLNMERSKRIIVPERFISEQNEIISTQQKKLQEMIPLFLLRLEKNEKKLEEKISDLGKKSLTGIFEGTISSIDLTMKGRTNDELLHECRKKIKFLLYNFRIMPQRFRNKFLLDTKYPEHIQDMIGNWHDNILYIQLLEQFPGTNESLITQEREKARVLANTVYEEGKGFELKVMGVDNTTVVI